MGSRENSKILVFDILCFFLRMHHGYNEVFSIDLPVIYLKKKIEESIRKLI